MAPLRFFTFKTKIMENQFNTIGIGGAFQGVAIRPAPPRGRSGKVGQGTTLFHIVDGVNPAVRWVKNIGHP